MQEQPTTENVCKIYKGANKSVPGVLKNPYESIRKKIWNRNWQKRFPKEKTQMANNHVENVQRHSNDTDANQNKVKVVTFYPPDWEESAFR